MYARETERDRKTKTESLRPPELELLAVLSNTQWVSWEPAQVLWKSRALS